MDFEFNSLEELYHHLKGALRSKVSELKRNKLDYIKEEDVWNCLQETKWKNALNLTLSDMVDDILNTNNEVIDKYLKNKISNKSRDTYFPDEWGIL